MAKRRPSGDGMVRKRDDGRWEGRIVVGHKKNGDPIFHHDYSAFNRSFMWLPPRSKGQYHRLGRKATIISTHALTYQLN